MKTRQYIQSKPEEELEDQENPVLGFGRVIKNRAGSSGQFGGWGPRISL